jgi:hypothetical protein
MTSCGKNHQKKLAKTWQITNIETATAIPESVKNQMIAGSQMAFTDDGKYTSSGGIGADQGTYTVDKEGKNLSTISQAGKSNSVYVIEKLTDNELVLNNNGNTVTCAAKNQ